MISWQLGETFTRTYPRISLRAKAIIPEMTNIIPTILRNQKKGSGEIGLKTAGKKNTPRILSGIPSTIEIELIPWTTLIFPFPNACMYKTNEKKVKTTGIMSQWRIIGSW